MSEVADFGVHFFAEYCTRYNGNSLPLDDGTLDRALREVIEQEKLESPVKLNFSDTRVGLRCLELEEMVQAAYEITMIHYTDNYTGCVPSISKEASKMLLEREGVPKSTRYFISRVLEKVRT